jgi:hypothetical protein
MALKYWTKLESDILTPEKLLWIPYWNWEKITEETTLLLEYTKENCFTCLQGEKKNILISEVVCWDLGQALFCWKPKNALFKCDSYMSI